MLEENAFFPLGKKQTYYGQTNDNRQINQRTSKIRKERGRLLHILIICTAGSKKNDMSKRSKKKKRVLRVLSIDYDFFQTADMQTLMTCYPDGRDLPTPLSCAVWSGYYAVPETREKLLGVKINWSLLKQMQTILLGACYRKQFRSMVTNSHKHIYKFIKDEYFDSPAGGEDGHGSRYDHLELVNVDMHHDMFNSNPEPDCGNWVRHIAKEIPTDLTWIANPVSKEAYGLDDPQFDIIENSLDCLTGKRWDLVFLCRSDNWTPPHLDGGFKHLADILMQYSSKCAYEPSVLKSRYEDSGFQEQIAVTRSVIDQVGNDIERRQDGK